MSKPLPTYTDEDLEVLQEAVEGAATHYMQMSLRSSFSPAGRHSAEQRAEILQRICRDVQEARG